MFNQNPSLVIFCLWKISHSLLMAAVAVSMTAHEYNNGFGACWVTAQHVWVTEYGKNHSNTNKLMTPHICSSFQSGTLLKL